MKVYELFVWKERPNFYESRQHCTRCLPKNNLKNFFTIVFKIIQIYLWFSTRYPNTQTHHTHTRQRTTTLNTAMLFFLLVSIALYHYTVTALAWNLMLFLLYMYTRFIVELNKWNINLFWERNDKKWTN